MMSCISFTGINIVQINLYSDYILRPIYERIIEEIKAWFLSTFKHPPDSVYIHSLLWQKCHLFTDFIMIQTKTKIYLMPFLFVLLWPGISSDPFSISLKNIKISAGKFKPTCSFEISYNDDRVSNTNVYCTSLRKTVKGIQYEYVTRTRHKIELTFTMPRKKRTAVVTDKKVETSMICKLYPLLFSPSEFQSRASWVMQ